MSSRLSGVKCAWLILLMILIPGVSMAKVRPPLTASLDLVTTPTAGGQGVAAWTGLPTVTPNSAEIKFILERPGTAQSVITTRSLALRAGQTAGVTYPFATPGPGIYQVTAAVTLNVSGGRFAWTRTLRINVPKTGPAVLERQKPVSAREFEVQGGTKAAQPQRVGPLAYALTGPLTISGSLKYNDKPYNFTQYTGTALLPIRRAQIQIRDVQGTSSRLLATTRSDANGNFSYTLPDNNDGDGTGYDLYIRVLADQAECRVEDMSHVAYSFASTTVNNWAGGNLSLGTITVDAASSGPWNIYDSIISGYDYVKSLGATPPKVTVDWAKGNQDGTYYMEPGTIRLLGASDDPDEFDDSVILHEYGHHLAYSLSYDKSMGGNHSWSGSYTAELAWSEGWATFYSSATRGRNYYFDYSVAGGISLDLELPTANPKGDKCEGAVAASLWDIFDAINDNADTLSDGMSRIWADFRTFNSTRQCVVRDFYNTWVSAGYPNLTAVQAILNEHGINYGWPLSVVALNVNNGSAYTISRSVPLNNSCTGTPAYYMASESSAFTGAAWKTWASAPAYSIVGAGDGSKTIYFKVKSASGVVSNIVSDTIQLYANPPVVNTLAINNGAATASSRTVTLNNTCSGMPNLHYMASESATFTGAAWLGWNTSPVFTMSAGNGTKTIYFKVRDEVGRVSAVKSDTITLNEPLAIATFAINNGAATASSRTVTLNNTCTGSPTQFMASESSVFTGAAWLAYSAAPAFTLSAGNTTKTVYFKIRNAAGQVSAVKSDTITLNEVPVVTSFAINNGAAVTNSRTVTLNNACTGVPASYMVSESSAFTGATWKTWAAAPAYAITGAGNGTKTLYFKVKNAAGVQSAVKTDTITLDEINGTLTPGGAALTATISPAGDYDWFKFTITSAGTYLIDTLPGTLTDNYMRLYGPNSMTTLIAQDNDSGTGAMAQLTRVLNPGTYYIRVQAYAATATGTFTVKLSSAPAPVVSSLSINNGDAQTWSRTVTLNNVCTGVPAFYMASERSDFSGAVWKTWSAAPSYAITGTGNGDKTIYFKVKDGAGQISNVKSDTITLMETFAIDIDGGEYTGNISSGNDFDLYEFTVASPGWYTIQTYAGTLKDAVIYLYDESGACLRRGDDQGSIGMPMLSENLAAGTYTVWVEGYSSSNVGDYSIEVKTGSAYKPLTLNGSSVSGNITWADDVNWFKFTVSTKGTYTIESNEGSLTDARMFLYRQVADQDGVVIDELLTMNDDEDPGVFAFNGMPWISTVLRPGTYYVSMENYDGSQTGTYTVKVRSGNRYVNFTTLIDNWERVPGSIANATYGAYYTFYVPSRGSYTITSHAGTLFDGQMVLYKPKTPPYTGDPLQMIDEDYDPYADAYMPEITRTLDPGTYYVWFSGYSSADLGTYSIELTRSTAKPAAKVGRPTVAKPAPAPAAAKPAAPPH